MRPYDVKSEADILAMESDNSGKEGEWSIFNQPEIVSIHAPGGGMWVEIPRDQFNALVDWYMADQQVRK